MENVAFYRALAAVPNLPDDLRRELGRRQRDAHRATWGGEFTLARTERRTAYRVGDRTLETEAVGMRALSLAVLNPGRDVSLGGRRSVRAWRNSIDRALTGLEVLSPGLARALAVPKGRHAPGLGLRVVDGHVVARWTRAPNVHVTVTSP